MRSWGDMKMKEDKKIRRYEDGKNRR